MLSLMTGKQRGQLLREWLRVVMQAKDDLADIITTENGKTIAEAQGEVSYAADFIDWYASAAPRVEGMVRNPFLKLTCCMSQSCDDS